MSTVLTESILNDLFRKIFRKSGKSHFRYKFGKDYIYVEHDSKLKRRDLEKKLTELSRKYHKYIQMHILSTLNKNKKVYELDKDENLILNDDYNPAMDYAYITEDKRAGEGVSYFLCYTHISGKNGIKNMFYIKINKDDKIEFIKFYKTERERIL